MPSRRGLKVSDVNTHLVCSICDGYLVDATTIIECLHSFCRTCIVRYLEASNFCPVCDVQVHKTRPLLSVRSDQTLQDLVYKLVPGLYQDEMQKRSEFYAEQTDAATSPEERGESDPRFFSPQENISLTLHHRSRDDSKSVECSDSKDPTTRHLRCPAAFTVAHLKKFLQLKFSLPNTVCQIDVFYDEHLLVDDYSLMDIAYIYSWKRAAPMNFFYSISKRVSKVAELPPPSAVASPEISSCVIQSAENSVLEVDTTSSVKFQKPETEEEMDVDPVGEDNKVNDSKVSPMAVTSLMKNPVTCVTKERTPVVKNALTSVMKEPLISMTKKALMCVTKEPFSSKKTVAKKPLMSAMKKPLISVTKKSLISTAKKPLMPMTKKTLTHITKVSSVTDIKGTLTPATEEPLTSATEESVVTKDPVTSVMKENSVTSNLSDSITLSASEDKEMKVDEPFTVKSSFSPSEKSTTLPLPEPAYNSVKLVSAPENNALLSPTNGFRLKFIHDPELNPKSQKSRKEQKKSGRKGGRSSRHKSVPIRLARLAPYPPPPVPATCLTTQSLQHLPQITVGKLVPTVITTLVSTPSNTLCNSTHESNPKQVASFISQPTVCSVSAVAPNFVPSVSKIVPESSHLQSSTSTSCSHNADGALSTSTFSSSNDSPANTKELPNINMTVPSTCTIIVPQTVPSSVASAMNVHLKISNKDAHILDAPVVSLSPVVNIQTSSTSVSSPLHSVPSLKTNDFKSHRTNSVDSSLILNHSPSPVPSSPKSETVTLSVASVNRVPNDAMLTCNTKNIPNSIQRNPVSINVVIKNDKKTPLKVSDNKEAVFKTSIKEYSEKMKQDQFSESFKMGVKNSISAEFSDNDDLGCQPDLVVDEQKMDDSSDNEDENSDAALRKKITAIAEEEDEIDVVDVDTEADSGVSCAARSEEDMDSPKSSVSSTSIVPSVSVAAPLVTTSSAEENHMHRHVKSNNINDIIKNLYRQHEISRPATATIQSKAGVSSAKPATKYDNGVLDLSTCTRKPGDIHIRPKTVANPVLDIKHRQQAYLPAPTNINKQHTVCPPAPKHNSSPLLLSHLTGSSSSILHAQLTGNSKSHHSSSYVTNVPFSVASSRPASTPSSLSGPNSYSQKLSPGAVYPSNTALLSSMIPYSASMMSSLANYANRNNMSVNLPFPNRTSSNALLKDIPVVSVPNNKLSCSKPVTSFTARQPSEFILGSLPNGRGSGLSTPSPAHPRASPSMLRMSPLHRSASPAPSPQIMAPAKNLTASTSTTSSSQSKPLVPIYKKQDNFKNYGHKFKGSNLAVFNPDPNGLQNKIVIKKLDLQLNNHH